MIKETYQHISLIQPGCVLQISASVAMCVDVREGDLVDKQNAIFCCILTTLAIIQIRNKSNRGRETCVTFLLHSDELTLRESTKSSTRKRRHICLSARLM